MPIPGLDILAGPAAGGINPSSGAQTGATTSGPIGGSTFGGINTGTALPKWALPVALAGAVVIAWLYFRRR